MARYKDAFFESALNDSNSFEQCSEQSSTDLAQRANTRWKKMLADYQPPPLDPAVDEELLSFMARRKQELPEIPL